MISSKRLNLCFLRAYSTQLAVQVPVIKVPKYVKDHIEKAKRKDFLKTLNISYNKKIAYRGDTSIPLISSNYGEYNHYLGQLYHENYPLPLQSKYWFKTKSSGQKFRINAYNPNPSLPSSDPDEYSDDVYLPNEFFKMKLNTDIVNCLREDFNFGKPTRIQTLAIPKILNGDNMLISSEVGAGKTVAYLAPVINELCKIKRKIKLHTDTPLALVVVPGRELAEQIADVAYKLGSSCKLDVKVLINDGTYLEHLKLYPDSNVDLLVATIGSLLRLLSKGKIKLPNLQHLVLDEADTLLDDSFIADTQYLLQKLPICTSKSATPFGTKLVLSSSIYPSNLEAIFCDEFKEENITKVCSPYLHRVPPHIEQRFWRVSNDGRAGEVLDLIKTDYSKKKPVMIFCNKSPTCDWLSRFLEDNGVRNAIFHGGVNHVQRSKIFRGFQQGMINVLCCTDLASRGLDTQRVRHVINFDIPNNVSDYLLRIGRVGRVGSNHGRVTNLVLKGGVYTVQNIEKAVKTADSISNVDSNIKKKINDLFFTY